MEDSSRFPMEKTSRIIRRSIYTFLQNYHYFTSTAALLAFPFSISILLSQTLLVPSSSTLLSTLYTHLQKLFQAAGFPPSLEFFNILNAKISQTISSSIFTLPFTLSFFLLAKALVIQALNYIPKPILTPPSFSSIISIFNPLLVTYICNIFLIVSANATAFFFLFLSFNFLEGFGFGSPTGFLLLSAAGAVFYSIILANALVICNLSLVLSGTEKSGGFLSILKACVMISGKTSTALSLALPVNLALAGIEALFQYRIVRAYQKGSTPNSLMILEGMLIAYLYSVFLVLDTIVSFFFFKSCKASSCIDQEGRYTYCRIEIAEEEEDDNADFASSKNSQEFP
ncbi:hypothetical protein JCGZ_11667 [Jatropha curcas]|uniref:Transmembrane protein n=1 Tax=Jatropha curcas TaxID=180498 RepID=A0A067K504_JATCU|nr:uncharacterized protein LOC105640572 [Jatropha curcas]KDP31291.1 hypothetical protein JCGZ_11667 [Jatropha curcas]